MPSNPLRLYLKTGYFFDNIFQVREARTYNCVPALVDRLPAFCQYISLQNRKMIFRLYQISGTVIALETAEHRIHRF